jgi:hypothetical protein
MAAARLFSHHGLMSKVRAGVAAGGFALMLALQATVSVAAAPVSQGHQFGKFVSSTAQAFPAGPQHGKAISALARSANPGQTRHAAAPASKDQLSGVAAAPVSQGHLFGKFVSATAHAVPAGPQHGKAISSLARSANPGHNR